MARPPSQAAQALRASGVKKCGENKKVKKRSFQE